MSADLIGPFIVGLVVGAGLSGALYQMYVSALGRSLRRFGAALTALLVLLGGEQWIGSTLVSRVALTPAQDQAILLGMGIVTAPLIVVGTGVLTVRLYRWQLRPLDKGADGTNETLGQEATPGASILQDGESSDEPETPRGDSGSIDPTEGDAL